MIRIPLTRGEQGWQGSYTETAGAGVYRLLAEAEITGERVTADRELTLYAFDREWSSPAADLALLRQMAEMTRDSGGRVVATEQLAEVLTELAAATPAVEYQRRLRWQPADTFLDALLWLGAIVLLLAGEWVLRKKWGLA